MAPQTINYWTTDPEYIDLLNFLIARAENVESPMSIHSLARKFNEKTEYSQTQKCLENRIKRVCAIIHSFEHIDTKTKVKMLFSLSASVNPEFLEELKKDAFVEVDEKNRIVYYKTNDGSIELRRNHSRSAKAKTAILEPKRSHQELIRNYFENKNNSDALPENEEEKRMWNLIGFIAEKCENVNSPLSINRVAKEFIEHFSIPVYIEAIHRRVKEYCREIQKAEFLDTQTSVKQLFGLSATMHSDYLEKLREAAHVEVDKKNRISYYKANNGDLELRGDHSRSAKITTGKLESKGSLRSLINSYFENMNDSDAVPKNKEEKEMWNLIGFITEKCENIYSRLKITQLTKDFNNHFGIARSFDCIQERTKKYCQEIQIVEFLDTSSRVKQLFGLGAKLDSDFLEKLRKDAVVEVDDRNRITKYTANDGRLTLHGDHSRSAKRKLGCIERKNNKNADKKHTNSGGDENEESEKEDGYSQDDSDEYSSEEFGSEFDSEDESDHLDKAEDLTQSSNETDDFDDETPIRNRSPTEIPIAGNLDFDPPTERSHRSEETEKDEDEENDSEITGNESVNTRSGRLSKRKHLDSEVSYNQANSSSSEIPMRTDSLSPKPAKKKKSAIQKKKTLSSLNQSESSSRSIRRSSRNPSFSTFSTESEEDMENQVAPRAEDSPSDYKRPRIQEMDDYDYNPREENLPESSSIDNHLEEPEPSAAKDHNPSIEAQNTNNRGDAVAPEPEPVEEALTPQNNKNSTSQTNGKEVISPEVPIKVENEEPTAVEESTEDVKPVTAHNPKIKFFEAMKSLILFLDTPSLSNLQSKIYQNIQKMKGSKEVLQNNELIPALELLIARMANHSVIDISEGVESVSLIQFFCYLKASILNSKLIGVEGLINNISGLIEKSQNKRIPMEKLSKALRATLDIDGF